MEKEAMIFLLKVTDLRKLHCGTAAMLFPALIEPRLFLFE
jgi:hypothetical protein